MVGDNWVFYTVRMHCPLPRLRNPLGLFIYELYSKKTMTTKIAFAFIFVLFAALLNNAANLEVCHPADFEQQCLEE